MRKLLLIIVIIITIKNYSYGNVILSYSNIVDLLTIDIEKELSNRNNVKVIKDNTVGYILNEQRNYENQSFRKMEIPSH